MVLLPPKRFNRAEVKSFLKSVEFIFRTKGKLQKGFILDLSEIDEISLIGQMLIYKFVSFTARNDCFLDPQITWNADHYIENEFVSTGFLNLLNTYINNPANYQEIIRSYKKLKSKSEPNYFFTPHSIIRSEEEKRNILEQEFLDSINRFYSDKKSISIVSLCISELLMNFWAHATDDSDTVLVARGGQKYFELIIADNAQGIISTLKSGNKKYKNTRKEDLLKLACEPGVSSKNGTFHQGYGLYFVSELTKKNNGCFIIYSEGAYIRVTPNNISCGESGYWKGTVIDLKLDLQKPREISYQCEHEIDQRLSWR